VINKVKTVKFKEIYR